MRASFIKAAALITTAAAMSSLATGPSAAARRFLLARHGETNFNAEGRIQGTLDSSQLTLRGIGQAAGLGHYVATHEAARVARVWVSPMTRARQTLAAVEGACEAAGAALPALNVRDDLREIELYHWEGRLKTEIAYEEEEGWKQWKSDPTKYVTPAGETPLPTLWERAVSNWDALRADAAGDGATLIVAHGAVGRCMVAAALGCGMESFKNEKFQFDNCWCAELAWEPDAPTASHWRWLYKAKGPWESEEDARRDAAAGRRGATAGIIA